jgi:MoaA/NifB/PqqE/SkfB family radical SAM enzyme
MKLGLTLTEKLRALAKFVDVRWHRRPLSVSIEVTKRCNARCDFCEYWKTKDHDDLADFTAIVRRFDPLVVVFTGGEPTMRRDLPALVRAIKNLPGFRYLVLLTNGWFLTEKRVRELVDAGIHQINISMNYPNARQDQERGLPGLFARLEALVPRLAREGVCFFTLASMLMLDNLHAAEETVQLAHRWGINIAFSAYNDLKNGKQEHFVPKERIDELKQVCGRLKRLKRELGNVMTSDYFFDTLPEFYLKREIPGCRAGKIMIHISPTGMVQPCAELAPVAHYSSFEPREFGGTNCNRCFDSCRAEPQAPVTLRRAAELLGLA